MNAVDLDGKKWQNPQEALKLIKEVKRRIRELNIADEFLQKNSSSYADLKEQKALLKQSIRDIRKLGKDENTFAFKAVNNDGEHFVRKQE